MDATVFVEALNLKIQGKVNDIALRPIVMGGDVTYPVRVELSELPTGLRWGMTAEVAIMSD